MISIIIPCYNGEKYLNDCLESIFKSNYNNYEIIVVDDNSTDKSKEILKKYKSIKVIYNNKNLGPSISRNKAAKLAIGNLLFFLDVDTKIKSDTLKKATKEFSDNNKMGAAQAQLVLGNTNKLDSAGHYLSPIGFPYEIGNNQSTSKFNKKIKILGGKSAGLIIRKKIFNQINGFDEDYFIYGEDTDLCWRVWLTGHQVYYLPKIKVRHFLKSSLNKKTTYRLFYQGSKNGISNLIKNLSLSRLIWLAPIHILSWLIISIKQIITGKFKMAGWIYRGIFWNLLNLNKTLKKRRKIKPTKLDKKILFGQLKFNRLVDKGWQWAVKL